MKKVIYQLAIILQKIFPIKNRVPVLLYHKIDNSGDRLSVSPELFNKQMEWLAKSGYRTILVDELFNFLSVSQKIKDKNIVLSFDDGHKSVYANAWPILKKYNFVANFFITTQNVEKEQMLKNEEIAELSQKNYIGTHFATHRDLPDLTDEEIKKEFQESWDDLEKIGRASNRIKAGAYPHNRTDGRVQKILAEEGLDMVLAGNNSLVSRKTPLMAISRLEIFEKDNLLKFQTRLSPYYYLFRSAVNFLKKPWVKIFLTILLIKTSLSVISFWLLPGADLFRQLFQTSDSEYFLMARFLANFSLPPVKVFMPIGYSLFMTPVLWFWPQISLQNISLIFSLLNGLLIFSGAGAVFYFIFNKIFKSQKWAFFSVGFLLFLPHIFYIFAKLFFKNIPFADLFIASRTAQLFWLQSGSDYLAAFFVYLIFWWLLDKDFNRTVLTGVLGSLAVMLRPQNFLIFLIVFLVLAFYKKWKKIGLVILSAVPFGLWQTWINWRVSGSVFSFGYDPAYNQAMAGLSSSVKIFSGENVLKIFYYINNYSPELFFPLIVIIIGLVVGAVYLWRLDKSAFFVFGLGGGFYLFALSFFETTFRNPRYFLPILPALLALSISLFLLIKKYIKKYVKTK